MIQREGKKSLASELRHWVWIQEKTPRSDGQGGEYNEWSDKYYVPAAVYPFKAMQKFEYQSINVEATHLVKIRGMVPITENHQIKFQERVSDTITKDRIFEILSIEDFQEQHVLKFVTCKE